MFFNDPCVYYTGIKNKAIKLMLDVDEWYDFSPDFFIKNCTEHVCSSSNKIKYNIYSK